MKVHLKRLQRNKWALVHLLDWNRKCVNIMKIFRAWIHWHCMYRSVLVLLFSLLRWTYIKNALRILFFFFIHIFFFLLSFSHAIEKNQFIVSLSSNHFAKCSKPEACQSKLIEIWNGEMNKLDHLQQKKKPCSSEAHLMKLTDLIYWFRCIIQTHNPVAAWKLYACIFQINVQCVHLIRKSNQSFILYQFNIDDTNYYCCAVIEERGISSWMICILILLDEWQQVAHTNCTMPFIIWHSTEFNIFELKWHFCKIEML